MTYLPVDFSEIHAIKKCLKDGGHHFSDRQYRLILAVLNGAENVIYPSAAELKAHQERIELLSNLEYHRDYPRWHELMRACAAFENKYCSKEF